MACDWIKMRTDLYRDPKVCLIAEILDSGDGQLARYVNQNTGCDMSVTRNVTRNATVGALVTVWGVMRLRGKRNGDDLVCQMATIEVLDDIADLPGFGSAMASVGWVVETETGVTFPRFFEDYNVDPAEKTLSSSADRQRRYRDRLKKALAASHSDVTRDASVDGVSNVTRDVTLRPREEKRREEKKKIENPLFPPSESSSPRSKRKTATSMPEGWAVPADWIAEAAVKDPATNWLAEAERFVSHHASKGSKFAAWKSAWWTWVRSPYPKTLAKRVSGAELPEHLRGI
jgi:hypothetical protein